MLIIGSGAWGQKVNRVLTQAGSKTVFIGAREYISSNSIVKKKITETADLIWICTKSDIQLKIIETLTSSQNTKIIIEKPVCADSFINESLKEIFLNQINVFISRPWNFSQIWINFKNEIEAKTKVDKIIVRHCGELIRSYINPPQDWLHHDLCLIQDLGLDFQDIEVARNWTKDFSNLQIQSERNMHIDISGGYCNERKSIFVLEDQNKNRFELDLNNSTYSILRSAGEGKINKIENSNSINMMLNYFQEIQINQINHEIELEYLELLQLLAID